jgi:hypothetical protein
LSILVYLINTLDVHSSPLIVPGIEQSCRYGPRFQISRLQMSRLISEALATTDADAEQKHVTLRLSNGLR